MSDVNKLDDKQCPFDPEQYKVTYKTTVELSNDATAPIGSFAWAIIQLNLGNLVGRKNWESSKQYLRLNKESGYIEEHDKPYHWELWIPKKEDMAACDWELTKSSECSEDNILVFDLTLGYEQKYGMRFWGFIGSEEDRFPSIGTINIKYDKYNFGKITGFYWTDDGIFHFDTIEPHNELFEQALLITVDDITYNLGKRSSYGNVGYGEYYTNGYSNNADAQKLSAILKQTGQLKTCCIKWAN
ncbi:Thoeris anti-defense Tad2 family protein [Xenorhabdus sp. KK7.4]|uniref:Thoeris anti-defense Tad2 family protein n=1 Tax=Xenorhabdus sp. KK7.4 TaxID=1851572 RepID=UPI000C052616|nr:MW1434 family type I TA system toxin [Xenorhabdus sp. KK7.4]PHM47868.1 hypothetical protein Xekk_04492 [Xenorhabdus sp. KK7.4]